MDGGGPRRELLMLLMGTIVNNGSILDGPPDRRVLRHNTSAFEVQTMTTHLTEAKIALHNFLFSVPRCWKNDCILHGGPGPVFFAVVIDYLFFCWCEACCVA